MSLSRMPRALALLAAPLVVLALGFSPTRALVTRKPLDSGWGAARVEVWGWRGNRRIPIVLPGLIWKRFS